MTPVDELELLRDPLVSREGVLAGIAGTCCPLLDDI